MIYIKISQKTRGPSAFNDFSIIIDLIFSASFFLLKKFKQKNLQKYLRERRVSLIYRRELNVHDGEQ